MHCRLRKIRVQGVLYADLRIPDTNGDEIQATQMVMKFRQDSDKFKVDSVPLEEKLLVSPIKTEESSIGYRYGEEEIYRDFG